MHCKKFPARKSATRSEKQAKTFAGSMSTIKDVVMRSASGMFLPIYDGLSKIVPPNSSSVFLYQAA
jgi:hypothetical protein